MNWTLSDLQSKGLVPDQKGGFEKVKKPKYRNKKIEIDGIVFDSKKEGARYNDLKLLQAGNEIFNLELQPVYELVVNGMLIGRYSADFRYRIIKPDGEIQVVVEDCKSKITKTTAYGLRKKLLKAIFNIEILET